MPLFPISKHLAPLSDSIALSCSLLFLPAILGISAEFWIGTEGCHWLSSKYCASPGTGWAVRLLALGTLLICLEQAHMAIADLQQIQSTRQQLQDPRLDHLQVVTLSTIAIELAGFYVSVLWLGWGALIVLLSQAWFNLLASIQIQPSPVPSIQPWGLCDRISVLAADGVGLLLVILWINQTAAFSSATLLLAIVLIYGWVKYLQPKG